jgi:hypothetical protein
MEAVEWQAIGLAAALGLRHLRRGWWAFLGCDAAMGRCWMVVDTQDRVWIVFEGCGQ